MATVLFTTTTLIAISIPFTKHLPFIFGLAFLLFFGFFDGLFWGASLRKVPLGAWFPLALGGALWLVMIFWAWAHGLEDAFDNANTQRLDRVLVTRHPDAQSPKMNGDEIEMMQVLSAAEIEGVWLKKGDGLVELSRIPVMAIFHRNDEAGKGVPHSFASFLQRYPALPEVVVSSFHIDATECTH